MLLFVGVSFADTQQLSSYEAIILHASILHASITDPTKDQEPYKLGPVKIPSVQQDGHSIKFVTSCDGCTLKITSDDGDIEYLVTIPEGATTISLPSYLSGEYCLQIIRGRFCFWSYIWL